MAVLVSGLPWGHPSRWRHPQSSGISHWTLGRPPENLQTDRLALRGHHRLVTTVTSTETGAGHWESPHPGAGGGEGSRGGRSQRQQAVHPLRCRGALGLSDTVRGCVLGLRAGDTPVAGLLDGLVVAPGRLVVDGQTLHRVRGQGLGSIGLSLSHCPADTLAPEWAVLATDWGPYISPASSRHAETTKPGPGRLSQGLSLCASCSCPFKEGAQKA